MPSVTTLQMLGLAGVLSYAAARIAAKAGVLGYNRHVLVAVPVSGMPRMPRGFRVEALSADQLAHIQIDVDREEQARRFSQGLACLAAYNARNECVGVTWVGTGAFDETLVHLRFVVPENAIWDTGLWVHPDHRLGRAFAALWAGTAEWMQAHGRIWSMSWIADYNLPSLASHRRMNSVTVRHITTIRFVHWQFMAQGKPRLLKIESERRAEFTFPMLQNQGALVI